MELRTLVVACLLGAAFAGPIARDDVQCSERCNSPSNKLMQFPEDKTYVYQYQSNVDIKSGDGKSLVNIKMTAKVHIGSMKGCEMVMRLKDVDVRDQNNGNFRSLEANLQRYPLRFSFDGSIESICPSDDAYDTEQSENILNIQRAILSKLQLGAEEGQRESSVEETDVLGVCQTKYEVTGQPGKTRTIKKTKNLNSCKNVQQSSLTVFMPYKSEKSSIQNIPVIKGHSDCTQTIRPNLVLQQSSCNQVQILSPFSSSSDDDEGSQPPQMHVVSVTRLQLVSIQNGVESAEAGKPQDLLFASEPQNNEQGDARGARQALAKLCQNTQEGVQPGTPHHINQLVETLRNLPAQQIKSIYEDLQRNQPCEGQFIRDMFVDALAIAGTNGPMKLMARLIQENVLSSTRVQTFFTVLAFNHLADEKVIEAFLPFLKDPALAGRQSIFGISGLIHNYCNQKQFQNNSKDCRDVPAVQQALAALRQPLSKCQSTNPEEYEQAIHALIGYKNIGRVGAAREAIVQCFTRPQNPSPVRIAALKAFNRVPRHEETYASMMKVVKSTKEDSEIRIHAFAAAIKYAQGENIDEFKTLLQQERVDQVSAFMWSYLTNIQESSSPLKKSMRRIIGDAELVKKFGKTSPNSRFYEWSLFSKKINAGYDVEAFVIHEGKEPLPRYFSSNVTCHLFGHSINLFEIEGRVLNLEHIVNKLFGPGGLLTKLTLSDIKQMIGYKESNDVEEDDEEDEPSTSSRFNIFRRSANQPNQGKPTGSIGVSVLGNSIARITSEDAAGAFNRRELFNMVDMVEKLSKEQEVERSYTAKVLDTQLSMPTISGFNMKIALNATVVGGFRAKGKMDVKDLVSGQSQPDVHIEGVISPSAAAEIQALIILNAGGEKSGLKAVFQSHTTHHIQGKIQVKNGRIVELRLDTPKQEIQLATVNYELYKIQQSGEDEPIHPSNAHKSQGCSKFLSKPLGIEFCYHAQAPQPLLRDQAPYLPNGGATVQVVLKKTDQSMRAFEVKLEIPSDRTDPEKTYKMEFNTPDSRFDRHFALEVQTQSRPEQHAISAKFVSPVKKINAEASWQHGPEEQSAQASVVIDGNRKYAIDSKIETSQNGQKSEIRPTVTITFPRQPSFTLQGTITKVEKGQKQQININLQTNRPTNKPSYIRGTITKEGNLSLHPAATVKIASDVKISVPGLEAQIHGSVDKTKSSTGVNLNAKYQSQKSQEQTASLALKVQNQGSSALKKVITIVDIKSSQFPRKNAQLRWEYSQKSQEHVENDVSIRYGQDGRAQPQIHVHQVSKLEGARNGYKQGSSENTLVIKTPTLNPPATITVKTEWDRSKAQSPSASFQAFYKRGDKPVSQASIHYSGKFDAPVQMQLRAQVKGPGVHYEYQDRLQETSPGEFNGHTKLQWAQDKSIKVDYVYRAKSDKTKTHHEVDLKMTTPSMRIPLEQKARLMVSDEGVDIRSQTISEGKPLYEVELHLSPEEHKLEAELNGKKVSVSVQNEATRLKVDYLVEKNEAEQYTGSAAFEEDDRNSNFQLSASWGQPEDDSTRLAIRTKLTREDDSSSPRYQVDSSLEIGQDVQINAKGLVSVDVIAGPHNLKIEVGGQRFPKSPALSIQHELDQDHNMNCAVSVLENDQEKFTLQSVGKFQHDSAQTELSWAVSTKSSTRTLNGKELSFRFKRESSSTPRTSLSTRVQIQPGKPYTANFEILQSGKNKNSAHLTITTPMQDYLKQNVAVTYTKNRKMLKLEVDAASAQGKRVQGSLKLAKDGQKVSATVEAKTPHPAVKTLKLYSAADYSNGYNVEGTLNINDQNKFKSNAGLVNENRLEAFLNVDSDITAKYGVALKLDADQNRKDFDFSVNRDENEVMATKLQFLKQGKGQYTAQLQLKNGDFQWIVDASRTKSRNNYEITASSKGLVQPVQLNIRLERNKQGVKPQISICSPPGSKQCLLASGLYSNQDSHGQIKRSGQIQIQLQKHFQASAETTLEISQDYFSHQTEVKIDQRAYQIEAKYDSREQDETEVSLELKSPQRQSVAKAQWKQAGETSRLTASFVPDAIRQPNEKLSLAVTGRSNEEQSHYTAQVSHPAMQSPKKASLDIINKEGTVRPLEIKATLELSPEAEDRYVAHVSVDDATRQMQNLTLTVSVYDQSRQNLDLKAQAHVAKVQGLMSAGFVWASQQSDGKAPASLYAQLDTDNENYDYFIRGSRLIGEGHGSWEVSSEKIFTFEENSQFKGEHISYKITLNIPSNCAELVTYDESKHPSKRFHVCANSHSREELLSLVAESYENEEKTTDLSLVLSHPQDETVIRASLRWSPEKLGEVMYQIMELSESNSLDSSAIIEALMEALSTARAGYAFAEDKYLAPFIEYVKKEYATMRRELQQEMKHINKALRKFYATLPNFRAIWEDIQKVIAKYYNEIVILINDLIPEPFIEMWNLLVENIKEAAQAACPYRSYCYQVKYAYNRHGIEGVAELAYSAVENMPAAYYKLVIAAKDAVQESVQLPEISFGPLKKLFEKLRQKASQVWDKIKEKLDNELFQKLKELVKEKWEVVKEYANEHADRLEEYLKDAFEELKNNPELKAVTKILKDIIDALKKELGKLHLEQATEHAVELAEQLIKSETFSDSIKVISMDPENGSIDLKFRYPEAKTIKDSLKSANPWAESDDDLSEDTTADENRVAKVLRSVSNAAQEMF